MWKFYRLKSQSGHFRDIFRTFSGHFRDIGIILVSDTRNLWCTIRQCRIPRYLLWLAFISRILLARVPNPPYGLCSCKLCIISQDFKSVDQDKSTRQGLYIHIFFNQNKFQHFIFQQWRSFFIDKEKFFSLPPIITDCCRKVVTFFSVSVTLWSPLEYY